MKIRSVGRTLLLLCTLGPAAPWGCTGARSAAPPDPAPRADRSGRSEAVRASFTGAPTPTPPGEVILGADLRAEPEAVSAAWTAYGSAVAAERSQAKSRGGLLAVSRFREEHLGRAALVRTWRERRGDAKNAYLDTLAQVESDGFLAEYVLAYLAEPGWTVPAASLAALKLADWPAYSQAHLPRHVAETHAAVREGETLPLPGADFTDVLDERVVRSQIQACVKLLPEFAVAASEVERRLRDLPELPVSVRNRGELVATLREPQVVRAAADNDRGLRWVAAPVARMFMAAGFCAVEADNMPLAERYLRRLLLLSPRHDAGVSELAQALVGQKRYPEALEQIERGLAVATSPCSLAMLWRKRGYVYIEQQRLEEARAAYLKSLELQPGNELARHELKLIAQMLGEPNYDNVEPPASAVLTTLCPQ